MAEIEVRKAAKQCNECRFLVHADEWKSRCVFEEQGTFRTYLERAPANQEFGLGCLVCSAYSRHHPDVKKTPFMTYSVGSKGSKLQLEDLLRHGNCSKSKAYTCRTHQRALAWFLGQSVVATAAATSDEASNRSSAPVTAAQCLLSVETCWCSLGAQGAEYSRRCSALNRSPGPLTLYYSVGNS